jgi:hypothetical protein
LLDPKFFKTKVLNQIFYTCISLHCYIFYKLLRIHKRLLPLIFIFRRLMEKYDKNYMNKPHPMIVSSCKPHKDLSPDDLLKTLWISTAMALILSLPPLSIFIIISSNTDDILSASLTGFGVHFVILTFSIRICSQLENFFKE